MAEKTEKELEDEIAADAAKLEAQRAAAKTTAQGHRVDKHGNTVLSTSEAERARELGLI